MYRILKLYYFSTARTAMHADDVTENLQMHGISCFRYKRHEPQNVSDAKSRSTLRLITTTLKRADAEWSSVERDPLMPLPC